MDTLSSKTCYSTLQGLNRLLWPIIVKKTNFRNGCTMLWKVVSQNIRYNSSAKHVICAPQSLNRLLWPLMMKNRNFVIFVQYGEKLSRKTSDGNVLKNMLFGVHKLQIGC